MKVDLRETYFFETNKVSAKYLEAEVIFYFAMDSAYSYMA
jgi:hypothetical protein